ncbi:MAG: hypothetical protein SWO11_22765 [Thermodesulfobacteriota bacterium]|nr:hypothetical protein [Thermodesulfobacteriota bacterium]
MPKPDPQSSKARLENRLEKGRLKGCLVESGVKAIKKRGVITV